MHKVLHSIAEEDGRRVSKIHDVFLSLFLFTLLVIVHPLPSYPVEIFDDIRLDILLLAMPISCEGTLQQYVCCFQCLHENKKEVQVRLRQRLSTDVALNVQEAAGRLLALG